MWGRLSLLLSASALLGGGAIAEARKGQTVTSRPAPSSPAPVPADPPAHHPGAGPWPAVLVSGVILNDDYPARAMRAQEQGDVRVTILVGRDGRVLECDVERSSGSLDLDWTTCRLILGRFRYDPARDGGGWAVEQYQSLAIAWRLADEASNLLPQSPALPLEPAPAALPNKIAIPVSQRFARLRAADYPPDALRAGAEGIVAIRLTLNDRGRPTGCAVIQASGNAALDGGTCALARRFHYRPARDREGRPLPAVADEEVEWRLGGGDGAQPSVRLLGPAGPPYPWVVTTPPKAAR